MHPLCDLYEMQWTHCPLCFDELHTLTVTPCYFCGGWPSSTKKYSDLTFSRYRLFNHDPLTLCNGCMLEEFLVAGQCEWAGGATQGDLTFVSVISAPRSEPPSTAANAGGAWRC